MKAFAIILTSSFFLFLLMLPLPVQGGFFEDIIDKYALGDTSKLEELNRDFVPPWKISKSINSHVIADMTLQGYDNMMCNNTTCWIRKETDYEDDLLYKLRVRTIPETSSTKYSIVSIDKVETCNVGNDTITKTINVSVIYIVEYWETWCREVGNETKCTSYWDWDGEYLETYGNISDTIKKPEKCTPPATTNVTVIGNENSSHYTVDSPILTNQFGFLIEGIDNNTGRNATETFKWIVNESTEYEPEDAFVLLMWIKPYYDIEKNKYLYIGRLKNLSSPDINSSGMTAHIDIDNKTSDFIMTGRVNVTRASIMTPYGLEPVNVSIEEQSESVKDGAITTLVAIVLILTISGLIIWIIKKRMEVNFNGRI